MELLIQQIDEKNNWGKNELRQIIADTSIRYSTMVMKKPGLISGSENTKENIVCDVCNHVLVQIQTKTTWGKNVIKEMIFNKLVEKVSC